MMYAKLTTWAAGTLLLLCLCSLALTIRDVVDQAPLVAQATVHAEMAYLRADLRDEIAATRADFNAQLSALRADANNQLDLTRTAAVDQIDRLQISVDHQLSQANMSIAHVAGLRDDVKPTITTINDLSPSIMRNTLGLIAAAKVTAGETAQMSRQIRLATPEIIASTQRIAANSDRTSAATAGAMANVQELTKPLPRWARVPLQVLPAATPFVLPFIR